MNRPRVYSGIYVDDIMNDKVYIGGGMNFPESFEYFNIKKNQWISLTNMNKRHKIWPLIWNDDDNPNIINIASVYQCKIFERIDIRENKWNEYKLNSKSFDDLFGANIDIGQTLSRLLVTRHSL